MKKASKFVASLLAGSMVMSMAACGNDAGNQNESSTPQSGVESTTPAAGGEESTPASDSTEPEAPDNEVAKPDKIKVMIDGTVPTQENYGDDFWKKYTELTGIEVEVIQPDHDAYYDVVGQTFAGRDWPDVIILSSTYYTGYASEGALWDMTDAYASSDLKTRHDAKAGSDTVVDSLRINGSLYGMPATHGNGCVTYVKQAWLDNCGITSVPTNYEEYVAMLDAFTNGDPDGDGVNGNTFAVAAAGLIGNEAPYTNYLAEFYQDAYPSFMQDASGNWIDGFETDAMKAALGRLSDAYAKGYIDPTTLTNGTGDCRNKFYSDEFGVFTYWAGTWANNLKTNLEANELSGDLVALPPIAEVGAYVDRITPAWCITSTCENPEGVFKYFIEAMQDGGDVQFLFTYGVEGKHWSRAAETLWADTEKAKTYEEGQFHFLPNAEKPETAYTKAHIDPMLALVDLEAPENSVTETALASQELFNSNCKPAFIVPSTDEMSMYNGDLTTLKNELIAKVTMGEMTIEDAYAKYEADGGAEWSKSIVDSLNAQ